MFFISIIYMLSIIFYTFTFSYFDDAKEHNIIMADYHYLYEASEKTKPYKALIERTLEVVDNDNGSNSSWKKLKDKKMLICKASNENYYYYEKHDLSVYPFKYNKYKNTRSEILDMTGKQLPNSCQKSTSRYILYR